nr:MarR family transcriptional regulator [Deinococcus aestuarii]
MDEALRRPPIRLWRRLVRLTQTKLKEVEDALAPLGLSATEFDLLAVVRAHEGATQQELAQRLLFSEANMTYHAQRLCHRGLIRREPSGKTKRLSLTPAGQELIDRALPTVVELHGRQFAAMNADQLRQFDELLRLLR